MTALQWTELPDKSGKTMTAHSGTWTDVIQRFKTVGTFQSKESCPWFKGARFGDKRTASGSLRHDENVEDVYCVEGDYDAGEVTIEQAARLLESHGIRAAFYPSPSSTAERPRWRVVAPLAAPHKPGARSALLGRLNGALGGILAKESFTLSQSYYFGGTPTNDYRVIATFDDPDEGTCIDDLDELDNIAIGKGPAEKQNSIPQFEEYPKGNQTKGENLFADAVGHLGRLLTEGDGRREMLKSYIASRSARGLSHGELRALIAGVVERYFDGPIDEANIDAIINWATGKDASKLAHNYLDDLPADDPQDVSISDLVTAAAPAPEFLTEELLPADVVTLLGAHGGTGKTTLALYWAVCLALGIPFMGKQTTAAKVLFYSAEDDADLLRWKLAQIAVVLFADPGELAKQLTVIDASAADSVFYVEARHEGVTHGQPTQAFHKLRERLTATGARVVILDNASDLYGADENNRGQVRSFIRLLAKLVRPVHGAVLLLAHVDKLTARTGGTQGYSGSTAWHNSVRSRLFLSADDKTGSLTLEHQKSNRGKRAEPMTLEWANGLPVLAQDLPQGNTGQALVDSMRLTPILTLIGEFYERREYVSTSTTAHTNAYKMLSKEAGFPKGVAKTDLWTLLRTAERRVLLVREDYQSAHRNTCQRWRLASSPTHAFSVSSPNENAEKEGGTLPASSPVGGMGGEDTARRTKQRTQRHSQSEETAQTNTTGERKND